MADVIDLDSQRPHLSGPALCRSNPAHRWVAVVPVSGNAFFLECPYCKQSGVMSGYLSATGLNPDLVQEHYERLIVQANFANALLLTALHQATDGEQGAMAVSVTRSVQ